MRTSDWRNARDYNRGLPAPARWTHSALAALRPITQPVAIWATAPSRRDWAPRLLLALLLILVLLPFDGAIAHWVARHPLRGDPRRELEALQQYGQGVSSLIIALVIWLQDPARRRRLADWVLAFALTWAGVFSIKLLIGRPRPKFDDPWFFLGPFGQYPVGESGVHHAWELWSGISSDLWSLPSAHTAYASVMAVVLSAFYPRLRILAWTLAALVGAARVLTNAHYTTDVIAGWALGTTIATLVLRRGLGVQLLDRLAATRAPQRAPASPPAPPRSAALDPDPAQHAAS